jgi:two-component system chemotaxis response regulator CheB
LNHLHTAKIIRVLVVDDSVLVRSLIREILASAPEIEVVGEACNGMEAISKAALLHPDLITMDIEMPVMGGLEAIERIMREHPVPILVVTAQTGVRTAFSAVSKGALEVIEKPDISLEKGKELIKKIRILATVDSGALQAAKSGTTSAANIRLPHSCSVSTTTTTTTTKIVAIASSTGGPQALHNLLSQLPADFSCPIVIAQHIADGFTQGMSDWLGGATRLLVRVAQNRDQLLPGNVYINPPEFSMRIAPSMQVILTERSDQAKYRPSCDILLNSVASSCHAGSIGVILSGMGDDGAEGMRAIKNAGGRTLAQNASSSVVYGMNRIAVEGGQIDRVLSLEGIVSELLDYCCRLNGAAV